MLVIAALALNVDSMVEDIFDLKKKNVIITGGLGLLGLNFTKALLSRGAVVCVIDILEETMARNIFEKEITAEDLKRVFYFCCDITNKDQLCVIRDAITKKIKNIDVLINNAALNPKVENSQLSSSKNLFEDLELSSWDKELSVNLTGTMLCCQVFGSIMKSGSSIINVASIYGVVGPDQSIYADNFVKPIAYSASKGGVIALTKYLSTYWGKKNIRVNCMVLGGVENNQDKKFIVRYSTRVPLGRLAQPEEYNGILIYLASDAASYSTGSIYVVDGGWTAW